MWLPRSLNRLLLLPPQIVHLDAMSGSHAGCVEALDWIMEHAGKLPPKGKGAKRRKL